MVRRTQYVVSYGVVVVEAGVLVENLMSLMVTGGVAVLAGSVSTTLRSPVVKI